MTTVEPIRNKKDIEKVEKYLSKQSKRDLLLFNIGTNCGLRISDIIYANDSDREINNIKKGRPERWLYYAALKNEVHSKSYKISKELLNNLKKELRKEKNYMTANL